MCEGAYIVYIPEGSQPSSVNTDVIHREIYHITASLEFIEDIPGIKGKHPKDTVKASHEPIKDASGTISDHLKQAPGTDGRHTKTRPEMGDSGEPSQISAENSGVRFEVGEECLEVILVSGEVYCPNTQQYLVAPCIMPHSVR